MPGSKFQFASTFGNSTNELVSTHKAQLAASPKKPRMLATVTTEMLNGTNTVVFDRTPKALKEARAVDVLADAPGSADRANIPGYAGCVRGAQHFYGTTYSSMTREAKDWNGQPFAKAADVATVLPPNRPPGYSGHVPLAKFEFANTFGNTCTDCVDKFNASVSSYSPSRAG